jgi:hypothetical protein
MTARLWDTLDTRERQPRSAGEQPRPGLVMPVHKPSKLFADCAVHREMTLSRQADQDKRRSARVSEAYDESKSFSHCCKLHIASCDHLEGTP